MQKKGNCVATLRWKSISILACLGLLIVACASVMRYLGFESLQMTGVTVFLTALILISLTEMYFDHIDHFKVYLMMMVPAIIWFLVTLQGHSREHIQEEAIHATYESVLVSLFIWYAMAIVEFYIQFDVFRYLYAKIVTRGYSARKQFYISSAVTGGISVTLDNAASAAVMREVNLTVFGRHLSNLRTATVGKVFNANIMGAGSAIGDPPMILFWLAGVYGFWDPIKYALVPCLIASTIGTWILSRGIVNTPNNYVAEEPVELVEFHWTEWLVIISGPVFFGISAYFLSKGAIAILGLMAGIGFLGLVPQLLHARTPESTRLKRSMLAAEREVERETPMMVMSFLFSVFGLQALGVLDVFAQKIGQNPSVTVVILVLIGLALASSFIDNIPLAAVTLVLFGSITNPVFWVMAAMLLSIGGNYLLIGSAAGFLVMGSKQLKGVVTFASFARVMFVPQTVAFTLLAGYASVVIYFTLG